MMAVKDADGTTKSPKEILTKLVKEGLKTTRQMLEKEGLTEGFTDDDIKEIDAKAAEMFKEKYGRSPEILDCCSQLELDE